MQLHINIQIPSDSEMHAIEAEAAVISASSKMHRASRIAIAARQCLDVAAESVAQHVRVCGLSVEGLVSYYRQRDELARALGAAKLHLLESEEVEASAEVEWENAVEHLNALFA